MDNPEKLHKINKRQRIPKGQSTMDNPEKLVTQGKQDKYTLENTEGAINNRHSRETTQDK